MKKAIKYTLLILSVVLFWKLFVLSFKEPTYISETIKESKKVKAFIGECKIGRTDTIVSGYEFPIEKIWVEKYWTMGRNRFGIVTPVTKNGSDRIILRISSDNPFFTMENANKNKWVVRDSLSGRVGYHDNVIDLDFEYNKGDTAVFTVYKLQGNFPSIWVEKYLIPIYRFEVICDW